jgi:hypothetical protein
VPWTKLGNLPWAELSASAFGRFETLEQKLLGEAKGLREGGAGEDAGAKKGTGTGGVEEERRRGGGEEEEAGASSEQLSHFVEDGSDGLAHKEAQNWISATA